MPNPHAWTRSTSPIADDRYPMWQVRHAWGSWGFLDGEQVPRVWQASQEASPNITPLGPQLPDLLLALQAQPMAAAAAFHAFGQRHRQPMSGRHGVHADPGQCVLAACELFRLDRMARPADIRRGRPDQSHIVGRAMLLPMTKGRSPPFPGCAGSVPSRVTMPGVTSRWALDAIRGGARRVLAAPTGCQRQGNHQQASVFPTHWYRSFPAVNAAGATFSTVAAPALHRPTLPMFINTPRPIPQTTSVAKR